MGRKPVSDKKIREMRRLRNKGFPIRKIAEQIGHARQTVSFYLNHDHPQTEYLDKWAKERGWPDFNSYREGNKILKQEYKGETAALRRAFAKGFYHNSVYNPNEDIDAREITRKLLEELERWKGKRGRNLAEIIRLRWLEGNTLKETGEIFKRTGEAIRKKEEKALLLMRGFFSELYGRRDCSEYLST